MQEKKRGRIGDEVADISGEMEIKVNLSKHPCVYFQWRCAFPLCTAKKKIKAKIIAGCRRPIEHVSVAPAFLSHTSKLPKYFMTHPSFRPYRRSIIDRNPTKLIIIKYYQTKVTIICKRQ